LTGKTRVASDAANSLITYHSSLITTFLCLLLLTGCGAKDQIERYTVAKQENLEKLHHLTRPVRMPAQPAVGGPAQMLAAMIPLEEYGWFFKVTGPPEVVGPHVADFDAFVRSIRFADPAGNPSWKLPAGWTENPGARSEMRFTTINLGTAEKPLDMSVIKLPRNEDDEPAYVLANVNRWRGQLQLPPLEAADLAAETKRVDLTAAHAIVVDITGESAGDGMGAAPFANRAKRPPLRAEAPASPPQQAALEFKTPTGWESLPAGGMRKAAFLVQNGDEKAEMTVIDLEAAAGALLPNINRWRGQLQLSPTTQADLDRDLKKISVGGVDGQYIELLGPKDAQPAKAMLGVVAVAGGKAWFFKFLGDAPLVLREKQHFEEFVRSVKFPQD
jgi:hypothetical protein